MTYKMLQETARFYTEHIMGESSDAISLLQNLNVNVADEEQCAADFTGKENPLNKYPAFLRVDKKGNKTVYYRQNTKYRNFYLMHEAAHYILNHTESNYQNEMDADLLACMLIKPIKEIIGNVANSYDLCKACDIPIDKADMYWNEIYGEIRHNGVSELMDMYVTMGKLLEQMKTLVG